MRLEGSLTRSRVKFCDSPMMRASSSAACSLALIAVGDHGELVDLLILAIALVGSRRRSCRRRRLRRSALTASRRSAPICGAAKAKLRRPRDFQRAHGGSGQRRKSKPEKIRALPPPSSSRRLAFRPAGWWRSVISQVLPVTSPLAMTSAAAFFDGVVGDVNARRRVCPSRRDRARPRPDIRFPAGRIAEERLVFMSFPFSSATAETARCRWSLAAAENL